MYIHLYMRSLVASNAADAERKIKSLNTENVSSAVKCIIRVVIQCRNVYMRCVCSVCCGRQWWEVTEMPCRQKLLGASRSILAGF